MTAPSERDERSVVVARFGYRYEAEFAAGFLDEAGIPYRLQVDDPSMGMTAVASAVIWVRPDDREAALAILDLPDTEDPVDRLPERTAHRNRLPAPETRSDRPSPTERALAGALSIGSGGAAYFLAGGGYGAAPVLVSIVVGVGLATVALTGRAPALIGALLRALSGTAP